MNEQLARKILGPDFFGPDGPKPVNADTLDGVWVRWNPGMLSIQLDGELSVDELEALAWVMRSTHEEGQPNGHTAQDGIHVTNGNQHNTNPPFGSTRPPDPQPSWDYKIGIEDISFAGYPAAVSANLIPPPPTRCADCGAAEGDQSKVEPRALVTVSQFCGRLLCSDCSEGLAFSLDH